MLGGLPFAPKPLRVELPWPDAKLTADAVRALLFYEPETGEFSWRVNVSSRAMAGRIAGARRPDGYINIRIAGKSYLAHRLAWLHVHGEWPAQQIDHKNRDKADNRISNLRQVNNAVNQHNQIAPRAHNGLGVRGVKKSHARFSAEISINGNRYYLGTYDTVEQASKAYLSAKETTQCG